MKPAAYQQATCDELLSAILDNGTVLRSFGGTWHIDDKTLISPLNHFSANARTLDVTLPANTTLQLEVPHNDTVLAYVFEGALTTSTGDINRQQMLRYGEGNLLALQASSSGVRLLLLTGTPLKEPIAQHGPFVMNTEAEIRQAIDDYRNGTLIQP